MAQRKSDEEISRANSVNLPYFLSSQGYDLKKVGRNEYTMAEHDSMRIYDNRPGETGKWYRFSENRGGSNIDFVREFMGKSFAEAVDLLNNEYPMRTQNTERQSVPTAEKKSAQHEIHIEENADKKRAIAYLSKTRGLDYNLVTDLIKSGQLTQEAKTGNAVFLIKDENGKTVGAEKVGTSTETCYKGIEAGSDSRYGFEVVRGNGTNAMFFESAIDMLSFVQLYGEGLSDVRFISMAGVKPDTVETTMKRNGISPENVYLCSDNDKAGNEFADKLIEKYPQMQRLTAQEGFKDWNDQLRNIPTQKERTVTKNSVDISSLFEKFLEADNAAAKFSHYSPETKKQLQEKYFAEETLETEWRDNLTPTAYEYVARFDEFIAFGIDVLDDDFVNAVKAEKEKFNAPFKAIAVNYWGVESGQDKSKHFVLDKFASFGTPNPKIPVAESKTAQTIFTVWYKEKMRSKEQTMEAENSPMANNIFGDTKYSDISEKFYVTVPADKAQEVSQILSRNGIKHSGRFYEDGKAKITISRVDAKAYKKAVSASREPEKSSVLNEIKSIKKGQEAQEQDEKPKERANKQEMVI